ncbi:MauE/DoxX family redox-associated membrane protein [Streptomyces sp. NPDC017405]|uniref:MauE/DoxX family redox-associated membrane protein n=1 Tax=unclassified Streptomyces TaxID=2593676 RepID=UPI0037BDDDEC
MIAAEMAVIAALWVERAAYLGFSGATLLLSSFTVFIAYLLISKRQVACACFGSSDRPASVVHLIRNLILLAIAASCTLTSGHSASPSIEGYLLVLAPSLIGAAVVSRLDDISMFFGSPASGSFEL